MSGFPLLTLDPTDLEKVITKLEGKSYCRLQQTCKDLKDFIGSSRKISVLLDGEYQTVLYDARWSKQKVREYEFDICRRVRPAHIDLEGSYGVRLNSLWLTRKTPFEPFCDMVKKYRIGCRILIMNSTTNKEGLATLLDLLKPVEINLDFRKSVESLEILYESKIIDLHIYAWEGGKNQIPLLQSVVEIFLSEPWPNLCRFKFSAAWFLASFPEQEQFNQLFPGIGIKERERFEREVVYDLEDLPQHVPQGAICQLIFVPEVTTILFERHAQIDNAQTT